MSGSTPIGDQLQRLFQPTRAFKMALREMVKVADDHAVYANATNILITFLEHFANEIGDLADYVIALEQLEDDYMPNGPPMSPLTRSYFTYFILCDLPFGPHNETMAGCFSQAIAHLAKEHKDLAKAKRVLDALRDSSMGIYQQVSGQGSIVGLKEIANSAMTLDVLSVTGYQGAVGQLWLVRLVPPFAGKQHVAITTPYILRNTSAEDWNAALGRELLGYTSEKLSRSALLKFGTPTLSWPEFINQAYANHQYDAIFLHGLPHVTASRPQADGRDLRPIYTSYGQEDLLLGLNLTQAQRRTAAEWLPRLHQAFQIERPGRKEIVLSRADTAALAARADHHILASSGAALKMAKAIGGEARRILDIC